MASLKCIVQGCNRTPPRGSRICGGCWSSLPSAWKLAVEMHRDALAEPWIWARAATAEDRRTFGAFLIFSWSELISLAALEIYKLRQQRGFEALRARSAAREEEDPDE